MAQQTQEQTTVYLSLYEKVLFFLVGLTIITTAANDLMRDIHERMPVIVPRDMYTDWLSRENQDTDALRHLIAPYPADLMTAYPVSTKVNSPNNDSPDLIQRAG
jgi:putative SOS response-associated peptidase YedK